MLSGPGLNFLFFGTEQTNQANRTTSVNTTHTDYHDTKMANVQILRYYHGFFPKKI